MERKRREKGMKSRYLRCKCLNLSLSPCDFGLNEVHTTSDFLLPPVVCFFLDHPQFTLSLAATAKVWKAIFPEIRRKGSCFRHHADGRGSTQP